MSHDQDEEKVWLTDVLLACYGGEVEAERVAGGMRITVHTQAGSTIFMSVTNGPSSVLAAHLGGHLGSTKADLSDS